MQPIHTKIVKNISIVKLNIDANLFIKELKINISKKYLAAVIQIIKALIKILLLMIVLYSFKEQSRIHEQINSNKIAKITDEIFPVTKNVKLTKTVPDRKNNILFINFKNIFFKDNIIPPKYF